MNKKELNERMNCVCLDDIMTLDGAIEIKLESIGKRNPDVEIYRSLLSQVKKGIPILFCPICGERTKLGENIPMESYYHQFQK